MKRAAILFMLFLAHCAHAVPALALDLDGAVTAPNAYIEYCKQALCADHYGAPEIPFTETVAGHLTKAQDHLFERFKKIAEAAGGDVWRAATRGDCEDYALRLRLYMRLLLPRYTAAFGLATAFTEQGDYHAVMAVHTIDDTIICDLRFAKCANAGEFPYTFKYVQNATGWHKVAS